MKLEDWLSDKKWQGKFRFFVVKALNRGVPCLFTFEEWTKVWFDSGHIHERGYYKGQYVMARFGDKGPYVADNVRICTVEENLAESWSRPEFRAKISRVHKGKYVSPETREKIRQAKLGSKASLETRRKMSKSRIGNKNAQGHRGWLGRKHTTATKQKLRLHNLGKKASLEARAKMSVRMMGNKYNLGIRHTPEARAKMSEKQYERWARIKAARASNVQTVSMFELSR